MSNRNSVARDPARSSAPSATAADFSDPDSELDERDDAPGEREARPEGPPEDEMPSLFERARAKLGLPEGASPLDLLRAIVSGRTEVRDAGPPRARCTLIVSRGGKRHRIGAGELIPDDVDPAEIPAGAVTGARR